MNNRGFTLLEAMVALVILSLVIVSTLSLHAASIRSASRAEQWTTAVELAEAALEELKLRSADEWRLRPEGETTVPEGYVRRVEVTGWSHGLRLVVVTVATPYGPSFRLSRLFAAPPR